jgi:hypothetical protein
MMLITEGLELGIAENFMAPCFFNSKNEQQIACYFCSQSVLFLTDWARRNAFIQLCQSESIRW